MSRFNSLLYATGISKFNKKSGNVDGGVLYGGGRAGTRKNDLEYENADNSHIDYEKKAKKDFSK